METISSLDVFDVIKRHALNRRWIVAFVVLSEVTLGDLWQLASDIDGRHLNAEHRPCVFPGQCGIGVRADGSCLGRPEDMDDGGHRREPSRFTC